MSYSAHFHEDFADAAGYGWTLHSAPTFDWSALIANKDREITHLNGIYQRLLDGANVSLHRGFATVEDAHTVNVDGQLHRRHILVATGGHPSARSGSELGITRTISSTSRARNARWCWAVAISRWSWFILNGLGSEVTLVYRRERLLRQHGCRPGHAPGR
jgi:glutathione reductase (NADPH)